MTAKKNKIVFIGPMAKGRGLVGGDVVKNFYIVKHLSSYCPSLKVIDTNQLRKSKLEIVKSIFYVLRNLRSSFIISTAPPGAYTILRLFRFLPIKNIIYWVIGGSFANHIRNKKYPAKLYKKLSFIIVEGKSMQNILEQYDFKNVLTLPNFKKIEYIPVKKWERKEAQVCKFVFLSRISPLKGCDEIIEAAKLLNKRGLENKYTIDFYGKVDADYQSSFEGSLKDFPHVNHKGFIDLRVKENYDELAGYDVMLFPTFLPGEGFAGILIDGFIAGLPIIATKWNLNADIVEDGKTGTIVPVHQVEALADAMEFYIKNPHMIVERGKNAQSMAMKYDMNELLTPSFFKSINL